ncbi:MAG: bacteriohemerythrin [Elusimicrobiota bacterium]
MNLIEWNKDYSVGIEKFDSEHKKLIEIINKLNEAMKSGRSKEILNDIISSLIKYTQTHFKSEEDFFKSVNYPEAQTHGNCHRAFVLKVADFEKRFKSNQVGLGVDVMNFLKDWLINHIQKEDKKYSYYKN